MKLSIRKLIAGLALVTLMLSAMLAAVCIMVLYSLKFPPVVAARPFWLPTMTMIFCILIGLLLSLPAMRIISSPLKKLSEAQKEITGGNFNVRLDESKAPGEMKMLFRSFNQMASELSETEIFRNDFINNFSHEFKTPIVSIRGFAHQLLYDDSLTDEQKKEYLTIIASESDRLTTMSANVLLLSKLEHQQIVGMPTEFYLDEQIRHCILLLEKQWEEKEIELNIDLAEIRYRADEELLSHVWMNLLSNAVKFTPHKGTITVSAVKDQDGVTVKIADNGCGIDKESIAHIFDKFYQEDHSRTTRGNGLGLSLVKRIVELMQGEVSVRSEIGHGSEFTVTLPPEGILFNN